MQPGLSALGEQVDDGDDGYDDDDDNSGSRAVKVMIMETMMMTSG